LDGARRLRAQIAPNILQPINKAVAADWHQACIGMASAHVARWMQKHDHYNFATPGSAGGGFTDQRVARAGRPRHGQ
jgi:hypothetical protein